MTEPFSSKFPARQSVIVMVPETQAAQWAEFYRDLVGDGVANSSYGFSVDLDTHRYTLYPKPGQLDTLVERLKAAGYNDHTVSAPVRPMTL